MKSERLLVSLLAGMALVNILLGYFFYIHPRYLLPMMLYYRVRDVMVSRWQHKPDNINRAQSRSLGRKLCGKGRDSL